jgi:hypothetical protein
LVLALERFTVLVLGGAGGASGDAEDASVSGVMVCWLLQRSSWLGHLKSKHFAPKTKTNEDQVNRDCMSSLNSNSILEVNTLISLISQFMGNFLGKSFYLMILKTKFVKKSQKA